MEAELAGAKRERAKRNDEEVLAEIPALCSPGALPPVLGFSFVFGVFGFCPSLQKVF